MDMKKVYTKPSIEWLMLEEEQMICESIEKSGPAKAQYSMDSKERVDFSDENDWDF